MSVPPPAEHEEYAEPPQPVDPYWLQMLDALYDYDILHIRQKILTLSEKYNVLDQYDQPRFYVVRPPRLFLSIVAGGGITILRLAVLVFVIMLLRQGASIPVLLGILISTNIVFSFIAVLIAPYRDIEVYSDESEEWRILTITQDNKLGLTRDYTLYDCFGDAIAVFRRNTLVSLFRRDWMIETPQGEPMFRVREDSLVKALLRRYLGPLYGLLRTNFDFHWPEGGVFGQYNRKLTLRDQYELNLTGDPERRADRRVTLAMSILLDTGESR